jgi:Ca2+-binding RTX toxin-like protein
LIGDLQNFSLTIASSASASGIVNNNTINLGNNTLQAGSGTDTLYGATPNLHVFDSFLIANASNHVVGGHDVFIGGAGPDTFVGGPGTNTLTGGTGADTFLYDFSLSGINAPNHNGLNNGQNTITNFNAGKGDVLAFHDVLNLAHPFTVNIVNAESRVVNDGSGHALVRFDQNAGNGFIGNGTSIDFTNIVYHSTDHQLFDLPGFHNGNHIVIA